MDGIVTRVRAFLRQHLLLLLGLLALLAIIIVLWRFRASPLAAFTVLHENLLLVGALSFALLLLVLILWGLPKWQASGVQDIKDRLTVENAARQTLAQIVGGAVLIAGLFFAWANLRIAQQTATKSQETATKNLDIAREGQITDRFTKAIGQLGDSERLTVRLGGIYALERIANESEKDHWPIIEVLTAYVRENTPWPPKPSKDTPPQQDNPSRKGDPAAAQGQPLAKLATDIQAVLTVLGRRDRTYETGRRPWLIGVPDVQPLDLRGTDLLNAHLTNAHLERADLSGAHLEGARLGGVNLKGAYLRAAILEGVDLALAHLEKAILEEAHLEKATLQLASLEGASLRGANLERANLKGARNLTVEQLSTVRTLYQAHIDPPLLEQLQQQYPHLLEKSQD